MKGFGSLLTGFSLIAVGTATVVHFISERGFEKSADDLSSIASSFFAYFIASAMIVFVVVATRVILRTWHRKKKFRTESE